ncbi:MAG: TrbI/VirB10 family protein, partial [Moraxella sp.]
AQAPKAETGVLVDVYGAKAVLANANQENAPTRKTVETATRRGNTSLMLIKGTNIPCVLKTKIDSTYQGFTVCQVSKDVYSSNGKTLLIERGSSVFGEQNIQIKHGQARVYVIWQKIETPKGVSVNVDSPATGQLGEMGVEARVNNHFGKRFGGAIMLSLIQDTISNASTHLQKKQSENQTTIDNTSSTMQDMATKALENSINIPPTAIVHQGTLINILVNRDMDFTSVYGVERVY